MTTPISTEQPKKDRKRGRGYAIALFLILAGGATWFCSGDDGSGSKVTATLSFQAAPADVLKDLSYAAAVRERAPDLADISTPELAGDGRAVCRDVANPATSADSFMRLTGPEHYSDQDAAVIITLAPATYCPDVAVALSVR